MKELKCKCPIILICDDNEFNIYALSTLLSSYGIPIEIALSGKKALEAIEKQFKTGHCKTYKLIFMDIDMPIMDGYETCSHIQ
jgi:aminomethyltransferase